MEQAFQAFPDDEEYVYLDEDGMAHQRLELTVTWNSAPDKHFLLTVAKRWPALSDSISYLEFKIGETMERFSLFEGLKGLHAVNLANGKVQLPKVCTKIERHSRGCGENEGSSILWLGV